MTPSAPYCASASRQAPSTMARSTPGSSRPVPTASTVSSRTRRRSAAAEMTTGALLQLAEQILEPQVRGGELRQRRSSVTTLVVRHCLPQVSGASEVSTRGGHRSVVPVRGAVKSTSSDSEVRADVERPILLDGMQLTPRDGERLDHEPGVTFGLSQGAGSNRARNSAASGSTWCRVPAHQHGPSPLRGSDRCRRSRTRPSRHGRSITLPGRVRSAIQVMPRVSTSR